MSFIFRLGMKLRFDPKVSKSGLCKQYIFGIQLQERIISINFAKRKGNSKKRDFFLRHFKKCDVLKLVNVNWSL